MVTSETVCRRVPCNGWETVQENYRAVTIMDISRRSLVAMALAAMALAACDNGVGSGGASVIDARADSALNYLYSTYPGTQAPAPPAS
jgi:hypothetical protein